MNQRRALHSLRKRNNILRADDVRAQSAFERGIEGHVAGRVNDDIDVISNSLNVELNLEHQATKPS